VEPVLFPVSFYFLTGVADPLRMKWILIPDLWSLVSGL
jgi:hypothetical protein